MTELTEAALLCRYADLCKRMDKAVDDGCPGFAEMIRHEMKILLAHLDQQSTAGSR